MIAANGSLSGRNAAYHPDLTKSWGDLNAEQQATIVEQAFKAKGATEEDLKEAAFAGLVLKTVLEKHVDEICANREFAKAVLRWVFERATPALLRAWAKRERA